MTTRSSAARIETKLFPGVGTRRPVSRPRLDLPAAVADGSCRLARVQAPAGYGKSTVLAQWFTQLQGRGVHCAWLSLDEDDNDPSRFLRYLIDALRRIDPAIGADAGVQAGLLTSSPKLVLASLAADLLQLQARLALFLDDAHVIRNEEVLNILGWLLQYVPQQMQFVVGSREASHLPLGRLRLSGQLLELSQHDLGFDQDEARRFCQARLEQGLSAPQLQQLMSKTEGWPAGLELAALALQDPARREPLIRSFAGSDRGVGEYLGEVVLDQLDAPSRELLCQAAQFDRFSAALLRKAAGIADAGPMLERLAARNLFLIALDRNGEWFRFHHLVGDFLRRRHALAQPADCAELQLRGARWLHAKGLTDDAINAAIRAQAWELAADWLARHIEEASQGRGHHQIVMRWLDEIPAAWLDHHPEVRIHYAFSLGFLPSQHQVEAQLLHLERLAAELEATDRKGQRERIDTIRCGVELQRIVSQAIVDQGRESREGALHWLQRWPQANDLQTGTACNILAFGHKSCSQIGDGLEAAASGRHRLMTAGAFYGAAWSHTIEAMLQLKQGSYRQAQACCESGMALVNNQLRGHRSHAAILEALMAGIAYEFDDLERARRLIGISLVNLEEYSTADILIVAYLTQARLQFQGGETEAGYDSLHSGQELASRRRLPRVLLTLVTEECVWLSRQGRIAAAATLARKHGLDELREVGPGWNLTAEKATRAAARLRMHDQPASVLPMLASALAHARDRGLLHRQGELLMLTAAAQQRCGRSERASAALQEALGIAAREGYRRMFLDEAEELAPIARALPASVVDNPALAPLVRALQSQGKPGAAAASVPMEDLTKQERRILRQLDTALNNREIAESLFVSEGTLKWHLHNIYSKLGVRHRSAAVASAKKLGLMGAG